MPSFWRKPSAIWASIQKSETRQLASTARSGVEGSNEGSNKRMATEFKLPELGENIESGDLVRLMIKPGASIAEGDAVMELETDKAVVEVPSSVTGTIGEIRVKEGDKLKVGQVIFTVESTTGTQATPVLKKKNTEAKVAAASAASTSPVSTTPAKPAPITAPQPDRRAKPPAAAPPHFK